jgi:hypothetical protein
MYMSYSVSLETRFINSCEQLSVGMKILHYVRKYAESENTKEEKFRILNEDTPIHPPINLLICVCL